jgi:GAF domain-containing protein/HAMP domain-containing protein
MRYQFSNIYDFMLVPITSIQGASTSLEEAQRYLERVANRNITAQERTDSLTQIQVDNEAVEKVIARYDTEWVTTASPQFTQDLKKADKIGLQQQEIADLASYHKAYDAYKATFAQYLATVQAGSPDTKLAITAINQIQDAQTQLQSLINVNLEFADFSNTSAQAVLQQALLVGVIVLIIGLILGLFLSYLIMNSITTRLAVLTRSAASLQEGKLDQTAAVTGRDEVSLLGATFNSMVSQLKNLFNTLESRVADRTRNLELAADVGRSVSQVRELRLMLKDAAELIRSQFDLYYVQVYLTNPSQTALILESGTGSVGAELVARSHQLPLNTASINGRAAMEKRAVVIPDTATSATFRPNPMLPDTRGEMAVPLLVGETVVGVLDMQTRSPGTLNENLLPAFEALAGQLAIAIQNANLLAEAEQARAEVEKQARRLTRANWDSHMDAVHAPEQTGFTFEHNEIYPMVGEEPTDPNGVSAAIAVAGEKLGSLVVELDETHRTDQNVELVNAVAQQVAHQLENLRLLESAERYRREAEDAARRTTVEGWQEFLSRKQNQTLSYLYDLNQVKPNSSSTVTAEASALTIPIKVHDETMGKVVVFDMAEADPQALDLINEATQRLSAHLDNLRLSQQTHESAQREHALRQFTSAVRASNNAESILRAAVRELGTILGRKTFVRMTTAKQSTQPESNNATDPVVPGNGAHEGQ